MTAAPQLRLSPEDYLAGEGRSPVKHEYVRGEVYAMAGTTDVHNAIVGNAYVALRVALAGRPCRVFMLDVKVEVAAADAYFYPDLFVTCDPRDASERLVKSHPALVVEVLSESTAAYDLGAKFAMYRQLPSLHEYVVVDPERRVVEVYRRNDAGRFELYAFGAHDAIELASIGVSVTAAALFEDLPAPSDAVPAAAGAA